MTSVSELIERLEKAEVGSRELDAAIAIAAGTDHGPREYVHVESRSYEIHDEIARHYTTSLDAALTLVPEGWCFEVGNGFNCDVEAGCCSARVSDKAHGPGRQHFHESAPDWTVDDLENMEAPHRCIKTPALALCIAALKARQSLTTLPQEG